MLLNEGILRFNEVSIYWVAIDRCGKWFVCSRDGPVARLSIL